MRTLLLAAAAAAVGFVGCVANPTPVPLLGSPAGLDALVREWRGTYEADPATTGRAGSILFRLAAGQDTAYGDVLMVLHPAGAPSRSLREGGDPWREPIQMGQMLAIRFVRSGGGAVTGMLEPYADPTCGCTLQTRFTGHLQGDIIEGTYTSLHLEHGVTTGGRWQVGRWKG